ncbi:MAG: DUF6894 family protein [Janthinobacterium lividum]
MTHYFFHLRDGAQLYEDPDGAEFSTIDAAIAEAFASARDLLAELVKAAKVADGQIFEITDEEDRVCARVPVRDALKLPEIVPHLDG